MLPATSEELMEQYKTSSPKAKFRQILTLGPRKIREVPPIFMVPGLYNTKVIHEICFPLLHPTFVAELPNTVTSLEDMANDLAKVLSFTSDESI